MEQGQNNVKLIALVHYDTGGTSSLTGNFDGVTWTYTWRNSFDHYGSGAMTLQTDESFSGWWIDKSLSPFNKGNWWLRKR